MKSVGMKEANIAKLAARCDELFTATRKRMKTKDWIGKVTSKQLAYRGLAQYYQSRVASGNKAVGEEIARLLDAVAQLKSAQAKSGDPSLHSDWLARASKALEEAQKDNDTIYHERVPDVDSLEPVEKASLAKKTNMPERLSQNSKGFSVNKDE